jgi:hypothetical protein
MLTSLLSNLYPSISAKSLLPFQRAKTNSAYLLLSPPATTSPHFYHPMTTTLKTIPTLRARMQSHSLTLRHQGNAQLWGEDGIAAVVAVVGALAEEEALAEAEAQGREIAVPALAASEVARSDPESAKKAAPA